MTKRKNHSPDFKAKVALEAIRKEMSMAALSKKYGVHPTQSGTWKRAAIENMATAFTRRGSVGEEQIIGILKERQVGLGAKKLCRNHDILVMIPQPTQALDRVINSI